MTLEELFIDIGYSKEEFLSIRKSLNTFIDETLYKHVNDNYNCLINNGYSKEDIIKMTRTFPSIYSYSVDNIKQKIKDIISLGYSKEEAIKMTKSYPQIYSLSVDNMKQKIKDIISLGYSKEEVIKITKTFPTIYSYSIDNIKKKIDFYDSINMHELAIVNPKYLMQSVNLSYSRYRFYKERGFDISMNNCNKLFVNNKQFERLYGIPKQELLKKYNYEEYMVEKNNINYKVK